MEDNCCEEKGKAHDEKCAHSCCNWKKCHMIKNILIVIIIIAAFCMGTQWGQMRAYTRGINYDSGSGMMNWYR